ncbi:MAG: ATP-binding protein [Marinisporobacter sp.]|jgi:signal transduction histidine kinase|nr:ATP-binding protein [Marinisporobacter sp.]
MKSIKKLQKNSIIGIIFVVVICMIFFMVNGLIFLNNDFKENNGKKVLKGVMYLEKNDLKEDHILFLNGEWSFFPNVFLEPEEVKNHENNEQYIDFPNLWEGKKFGDTIMEEKGYGTYQVKLINKGKPEKVMFYFTPSPAEAYKVYMNDELVLKVGEVGKNKETTKAEYKTEAVTYDFDKELTITIQVASFTYNGGGYYKPIIFGKADTILKLKTFNLAKDVFILGVLTILFLYFGMTRIKNKHTGYVLSCFVATAFLGILYTVSTGEMIIRMLFPQLPFRVYYMMYYMISITGGSLYIFLLSDLFPVESNRKIKDLTTIKVVIFIGIILFFENYFIGKVAVIKDVLVILEFLYGIYVLSKATYNKKRGSITILFGTISLIAAVVYDILYLYAVFVTPYELITPFGLATFILCFAIILSRRYESSFQEVENLSKRLIEMDKIKDQFLANTSHELRTPLNSMIALTKSLLEESRTFDLKERESLDMVISSGKRLRNLVNDLLDYSSMKYSQIKLVKSHFDIKKAIENTIKEFEPIANNKNIKLSSEIEEEIKKIYGDKYRFIQVLYNLIGNAIKFTPENGHIHIKVYKKENKFYIAIEDTGIGISEEKLKNIFNSFEQANEKIGEKYGGFGLGLSISKEIILAHEGELVVDSREGVGSIFTIILPMKEVIVEDEVQEHEEYNLPQIKEDLQKNTTIDIKGELEDTIVIIDDYYSNIFAAASILKTEGYSIKGYVNAEEGMDEINNNPRVVLAIIDLMMPEISGEEICKRIREKFDLLQLPILVLTANMQMSGLVKSFENGANDFLHKPFETEELKARVRTLAQLKKAKTTAIENELSMLQAQINPHFLYNAMNAIAACCYDSGEKAADIIIDLADYLRYTFEFDHKIKEITLSKELELVKVYLAIEKIRFEDQLEYEFHIEDEVFVTIPPFTLQTIVENAVRHGIRKKPNGGKITIKGSIKNNYYSIEIKDTGIGMTKEDLELVLAGKKSTGTGLGIANVRRRLKSIYGTNIKIESNYGQGTNVILQLGLNKI